MSYGSRFEPSELRAMRRAISIHADTRPAQRQFRRWERQTLTAERRTLLRAAGNVRRMEIAMVQGRKSKAGPKVAPLDKSWRRLLHPHKKMGGALAQKHLWHIAAPNPHEREVDIVSGLQKHLERWEFGGGGRESILRDRIAFYRDTPRGRAVYHGGLARQGWPAHLSQLPPITKQPRRAFKADVERYADRHMAEWYAGIWRTMQRRG